MGPRFVPGRGRAWLAVAMAMALAIAVAASLACVIRFRPERDPDRLWRLVHDELKSGRPDRAEVLLDQLSQLRPPGDPEWLVRGQVAMTRGDDDRALASLARVGDSHPMSASARVLEGTIELKNRRARRAEAAFLRAVRLDPGDTTARLELIRLYCIQRRRRDLSDQFLALSRQSFLTFNQTMLWATSLASSWNPAEVHAALEGFVKADPADRTSRLVLAESLRRLRRPDEVEVVLSRLPSSDPDVRAIRARIAEGRGDDEEVDRLTRDNPNLHPVLARVRASLALSRRDLPAARDHLRAALAADPHNRAVLFQLGDTLNRLGEVDEGRKYVAAARDHDRLYDLLEQLAEPGGRNNGRLLAEVASTSLKVGLHAEARAWFFLALDREPANPDIQKAIYRLERAQADLDARASEVRFADF